MKPIVIVGAGPGGASLALLLARRGIDVVLVERQRDFSREFRGEVLQPSGLDAIRQMRLWEPFKAIPQVQLAAAEFYINGRRRSRISLAEADFSELTPSWVSQPAFLELLVAEAGKFPGFRFERGVRVRDLLVEGGRVAGVELADDRRIEASIVIGADGRTSVVRRRSGIEVECDPLPMDVVWCKLPLPEFFANDHHLRAYVGHGHLLIAAPVYDGHMQIAWIIAKGSFGDIGKKGMPECLDAMAAHVSDDLADVLAKHRDGSVEPFVLTTVSDRAIHWSRPGLLLIGDAAHTMSPVGGQGINIALRDALVAANHLVPAYPEGEGALDQAACRIEQERLPEVSEIQRLQAVPPRFFLRDNWWLRLVLPLAPTLLGITPARRRQRSTFQSFAFGVTEVKLTV